MTRVSRLSLAALLALVCLPLGGCFGSSDSASNEPPLPPVLYVVTQHSEDGKLLASDIASNYYTTDGSCVSYVNPDDPKNATRRVLCGGLLRVLPKTAATP